MKLVYARLRSNFVAAGLLLLFANTIPAHGQVAIVFYRVAQHEGMANRSALHIDGSHVHSLGNGRTWTASVPAGTHRICADRCEEWGRDHVFETGQTYYFRVTLSYGGVLSSHNFRSVLVPAEIGSEEMVGLRSDK